MSVKLKDVGTDTRSIKSNIKLFIAAICLIGCLVVGAIMFEITTVHGNELGVKETWSGGVEDSIYAPKTYFLFPGATQTMYTYDMTPQIFVMNNREDDERANGRKNDAYVARSSDNQTMLFEVALQWHFNSTKIVSIHKRFKCHSSLSNWQSIIEERLIRQNLMIALNTEATARKAIDSYSGDGFVSMQNAVFQRLIEPGGELSNEGVQITSFVIEKITLDEAYIGEINKRQVAQQRELRAKQEELAALAEAQRAKAESQSDYEKQLVEARREKEKLILSSEAQAKQRINQANADAESKIIAANAERDAALARAAAIRAIGEAEAEAKKLQLMAYSVPGAESFVQIEISKSMADAFKNIQGYLPQDMHINLLSDNFIQSVQNLVNPNKPVTASK